MQTISSNSLKTKKPPVFGRFSVGLLGLEPRTTEPKSAVLPLHHRPYLLIAGANVAHIFIKANFRIKNIKKNNLPLR